jgi:multidrug efflux system membrane fusion protein
MRRSTLIAGAIALAAAVWIGSGLLVPHEEAAQERAVDAMREAEATPPQRVRVREMTARETITPFVVHGHTKASRQVVMRAETGGRVVEVPVNKGALVAAGDVLARLDMGNRRERLDEAQALVAQRELEFNAASSLAKSDHGSRTRLAETRAELEAARAALAAVRKDIADTVIRAPVAAMLNHRAVEIGDLLSPGGEVATLLDLDPGTVSAEASERVVGRLSLGAPAEVRLIDGRTVQGTVAWVSSSASPGTRTYPLEIAITNPQQDIPEGMTAEIRLALETVVAHLVSPAVLTLNDAGAVGVKLVDESDTVQFARVEIVRDSPEGMWLAGLPEHVRLITVGQEFVLTGQRVVPVPDDAGTDMVERANGAGVVQ